MRLADNPALAAALERGRPVLPVYVLDEEAAGSRAPGGAGRWWLHHSLAALSDALRARGNDLLLLRGSAEHLIPALAEEVKAGAVFWNRCYEPWRRERDSRIKSRLRAAGVVAESYNSALLVEPWGLQTGRGGYRVFGAFWKALRQRDFSLPLAAPGDIPAVSAQSGHLLEDWKLVPALPDWAAGLRACWNPGEEAAAERLGVFLDEAVAGYGRHRDRLQGEVTSRLSPHLHWGEIGPRQVWHAALHEALSRPEAQEGVWKFLSELGWREFSYHLLYHRPDLPQRNWRTAFDAFPWRDDPDAFKAWSRGRTGYPLVDAGMRQLWHEGWLPNRVRMVVASFLVKHLLQPWQRGEAWFWDTLVDADLANNPANWQWVSGSGADAAPYFRIFNPLLQSKRFDPHGVYLRRWLPELAALPDRWLHQPWEAPSKILAAAGVTIGRDYPAPIVDHAAARQRALEAFEAVKGRGGRDAPAGAIIPPD